RAEVAFQAIAALAARGQQAVDALGQRLAPVPPADPKQVARLLAALNDERFAAREQATAELAKLGEQIGEALRKALQRPETLEQRRRVEQLLQKLQQLSAERLRSVRVVEVLEQVATPAAHKLVAALAGGAPEARQTQEARATRERLEMPPRGA